jgi:hypothetical protein
MLTVGDPTIAGPRTGCGHAGHPCASGMHFALSPNLDAGGISSPFPTFGPRTPDHHYTTADRGQADARRRTPCIEPCRIIWCLTSRGRTGDCTAAKCNNPVRFQYAVRTMSGSAGNRGTGGSICSREQLRSAMTLEDGQLWIDRRGCVVPVSRQPHRARWECPPATTPTSRWAATAGAAAPGRQHLGPRLVRIAHGGVRPWPRSRFSRGRGSRPSMPAVLYNRATPAAMNLARHDRAAGEPPGGTATTDGSPEARGRR